VAIKIGHALGLAETQGTGALVSYVNKRMTEAKAIGGPKASKRIVLLLKI
jgi:ERCC4-related helicase